MGGSSHAPVSQTCGSPHLYNRTILELHREAPLQKSVTIDPVLEGGSIFMNQDPRAIQRATYLLWVAHNLERIAVRATNIAERVIFFVTGKNTLRLSRRVTTVRKAIKKQVATIYQP